MRNKIAYRLLFAFTFIYGIYTGGGLFEAAVIAPVWSASAEAARAWGSDPLTAIEGARFFLVVGPLSLLLAIATIIAGWKAPAPARSWLRLGMTLFFIQYIATLGYFVPEQLAIKGEAALRLANAEIVSRASRWVALNYVRSVWAMSTLFVVMKGLGKISDLD